MEAKLKVINQKKPYKMGLIKEDENFNVKGSRLQNYNTIDLYDTKIRNVNKSVDFASKVNLTLNIDKNQGIMINNALIEELSQTVTNKTMN